MKAKKVPVEVITQGISRFTNPVDCLKEIATAYTDYKTICQQEETKRQSIEAWQTVTVAKIESQRDFLMAYLDRSFDERAENFRALFAVVDQAIASGSSDQLALALHSITEIAKTSPLKELSNLASVRAALDDPNHEWKF